MKRARLLAFALVLGGCTCGKAQPAADGGVAESSEAAAQAEIVGRPPQVEQLWSDAREGDETELARLADREGAAGLVERASDPRFRVTALQAMGSSRGFAALPTLGLAAKNGAESEALMAVDSAAQLAAAKRRQVEPDEADELREGCAALLASAKDTSRPRLVRVGAVRTLRMLVDRCGVKAGDIPTDVDVK